MKTFIIKQDGKEISRENVSDCKSIAEYANRKFGSVDPASKNMVISIHGAHKPAAEPKAAEVK